MVAEWKRPPQALAPCACGAGPDHFCEVVPREVLEGVLIMMLRTSYAGDVTPRLVEQVPAGLTLLVLAEGRALVSCVLVGQARPAGLAN